MVRRYLSQDSRVQGVSVRQGLVSKANRLLHHSTPGSRVMMKKKKKRSGFRELASSVVVLGFEVKGLRLR